MTLGRSVGWVTLMLGMGIAPLEAQLPWQAERWRIEAAESRFEPHLGREALYLRNGTAWLQGVSLRDGVVEFDLAAPRTLGFHGLRFRAVDDGNHEHVYLRPHLSGLADATQYNPVIQGVSGWQIYADARYQLPVDIPADRWMRVRVAIRDRRMELSVDGGKPLVYPQLVRDPVAGAIGLDASGSGVWFANVVVRPDADPGFTGGAGAPPPQPPADVVTRWRVSAPFGESLVDGVVELPSDVRSRRGWTVLDVEDRGVANLARVAKWTPERNTVFAAVTLVAEEARTVALPIGFSDRVRVFVNGRQVFAGADGFGTRDYRFLGTVGFQDTVFLPLHEGENEVWLAVSETFGGWAAAMRVPETAGVRVVMPMP